MNIQTHIRAVPNFPKPGVVFQDVTPLLANPVAFQTAIDQLVVLAQDLRVEAIGAFDARGFWFAPSVALKLGVGWFPIRKPGKLPGPLVTENYGLEYGTDCLAVQGDAVAPGTRVLLIDDVLATGGTMAAGIKLVEALGATVVGTLTVIELTALGGRAKLAPYLVRSLLTY